MNLVNRTLAIVRTKQPYATWANSLEEWHAQYSLKDAEPVAYLIRDSEGEKPLSKMLDRSWKEIFEEELDAWSRDPKNWPARRTRKMFNEWFDVEVIDMVVDLDDRELVAQ